MRSRQVAGAERLGDRIRHSLARPVDGASLAVFRIGFGLVMFWSMAEYLWPRAAGSVLNMLYVEPAFNFAFPGFEWLRPWPEPFLSLHCAVVGLAGLCMAAGIFYRAAAACVFVGYTYFFLLEQACYNNHYYLICLIAFLLACMPADRCFSLRSWFAARRETTSTAGAPPLDSANSGQRVPYWTVLLLRAQMFIVYFFGGIAKLDADWLTGEPLAAPAQVVFQTLTAGGVLPPFVERAHVAFFMAYVGLAYDLAIGFLMLVPRTRVLGLCLTCIFHGINHFVFPIGVFPTLALSSTLIFFDPDWPRRVGRWLRRPTFARPNLRWLVAGGLALPGVGAVLGWRLAPSAPAPPAAAPAGRWTTAFVLAWIGSQAILPFRHFTISGDASWTEEGQFFAWRMMLRMKAPGYMTVHLLDPELRALDDRGRPQVQWEKLPAGTPRAIYTALDCHKFNWSHHPGLSIVYEPVLGYRIAFHSRFTEDTAVAHELEQVRTVWQSKFGRRPEVVECKPLVAVLQSLAQTLAERPGDAPADSSAAHLLGAARRAATLAESPVADADADNARGVALVELLGYLTRSDDSSVVRDALARLEPFALQGANLPGRRFVVLDPQLSSEERDAAFERLRGADDAYLVWFDPSRLPPGDWRGLPRWYVAFDGGKLPVVWNYFGELHARQAEMLAGQPFMIRQYARRIAAEWERATGRRPQVRAHSLVMVNYRYPQFLVDPAVDLATIEYRFLRHNDWILPYTADRLSDRGGLDPALRR